MLRTSYLISLMNMRWFIDSLERKPSSEIRRKSEQLVRRRISMEEKVIIITIIIIIIIIIITKLAEVITEESNLREENRRMSIMIAEAEQASTIWKYLPSFFLLWYVWNTISGFGGPERRKCWIWISEPRNVVLIIIIWYILKYIWHHNNDVWFNFLKYKVPFNPIQPPVLTFY